MTAPIEIKPLPTDLLAKYLGRTERTAGGAAATALRAADLLDAAAALIADPASWTCGAFARDSQGREVDYRDANAVRYCAMGALYRASIDGGYDRAAEELSLHTLHLVAVNSGFGDAFVCDAPPDVRLWNIVAINNGFGGGWTDPPPDYTHTAMLQVYRQAAASLRSLSYRGLAKAISERAHQLEASLHSA